MNTATHNVLGKKRTIWFAILFIFIAVVGLSYVKWWPYYHKAILSIDTHSIGDSILSDQATGSFSWQAAADYAMTYFQSVWKAAVLGVLLGSLVQVLLPSQWLLKVLGKTSFGSTAVAGLASIPGMMCTCCAAPVAVGLRKKNASVGASLAFWIGNPTINPATLIFMTFVLSWKFTLLRLVIGIILTFGISYLANRFVKDVKPVDIDKLIEETEQTDNRPFIIKWLASLGSMLIYIVPVYILSVLVLGAARFWLFPQLSDGMSNGIIAIILFAIAGMLFVIPTAAEIPIIQTLMAMGLGAGPAAALLITLPSISLPSIIMVGKSFPKKVLAFVVVSVVVLGIVSGFIGKLIL
ncbi:MAG TPA: permease [Niallia sp.]|nr:permease [Niallia sp.]